MSSYKKEKIKGEVIGNLLKSNLQNNKLITLAEMENQIEQMVMKKLNLRVASNYNTGERCLVDDDGKRYKIHLEEKTTNEKIWPVIATTLFNSKEKMKEYVNGYDKIAFVLKDTNSRKIILVAAGLNTEVLLDDRLKEVFKPSKYKDEYYLDMYNCDKKYGLIAYGRS